MQGLFRRNFLNKAISLALAWTFATIVSMPVLHDTVAQHQKWSWADDRIPDFGEEPIRTGRSVRLGGYTYTFENWTLEEKIQWVGRNLDIWSYDRFYNTPESLAEIRAMNPAICLLDTFVPIICDSADKQWLNVGGYDDPTMGEWVLRKNDDSEAENQLWAWSDTHTMDIGNLEWADYFKDRARYWVRAYGGDGYSLDGVPWDGVYYLGYGYGLRDSSPHDVNNAISRFLEATEMPDIVVLDDQSHPSRQEHVDGVWDEAWMVYDSKVPWPWQGTTIGTNWDEAVEHLEFHSRQLRPYIAQAWYMYGDRRALEFMLASYLMGKQSNSATFMPTPIGSPALPADASYDLSSNCGDVYRLELEENMDLFEVQLGPPLANRVKLANGVYMREFSEGRVYVNPSRHDAQSMKLEKAMTNLIGNQITHLEIGPRTGVILVNEALPPAFAIILILGFRSTIIAQRLIKRSPAITRFSQLGRQPRRLAGDDGRWKML